MTGGRRFLARRLGSFLRSRFVRSPRQVEVLRRCVPHALVVLAALGACAGPGAGPAPRTPSIGNVGEVEPSASGGTVRDALAFSVARTAESMESPDLVAPVRANDAPVTSLAAIAPAPSATGALAAAVRPDLGSGMVLAGVSAHRMILFTFDDGPHPWHTRRLLEHLARAQIRGVFFVNAHRFDRSTGWYADCALALGEIAAAGHVIGNHGRDHELTATLEGAALDAQVIGAEDIFVRVLGARPWLFRPPGGVRSDATDAYLSARGYTQLLWTLHTGDYETRDSDEVLRNFRESVIAREHTSTPGGIAVIHDSHPWGVAAFPRMVRFLRRRNCELLARGEELYDIVDDPSLFFVPRGAGASASEIAPVIRLPPDVAAERQARLRERERERCDGADAD